MDVAAALQAMRDPAGVPASPLLFQGLMVASWVAHIAFVHLALGASLLAIIGFHRRGAGRHWEQLSISLTQVAKVSVSLLIVLGVAPLLFTQVIYDPLWYASNVLSGRWAIAFILTLILAYCLWFAFYAANRPGARRHVGLYAWSALALFCLDGLIMHALSYQALQPDKWMQWYAPQGAVDASGAQLHAVQWSRFLFIMSLSLPLTGTFLSGYARYLGARADRDPDYLDFCATSGRSLAGRGYALAAALFLTWQVSLPAGLGLTGHPLGRLLFASLLGMALWLTRSRSAAGYAPLLAAVGVLGLLAVWREIIRIHCLRPFGYVIDTYPVHADLPSTALFFLTLAGVGGLVGGFYLALLYRAGRVAGVYVADARIARLGTLAIAVLGLWMATFFAYGIVIFLHRGLL